MCYIEIIEIKMTVKNVPINPNSSYVKFPKKKNFKNSTSILATFEWQSMVKDTTKNVALASTSKTRAGPHYVLHFFHILFLEVFRLSLS